MWMRVCVYEMATNFADNNINPFVFKVLSTPYLKTYIIALQMPQALKANSIQQKYYVPRCYVCFLLTKI